MEPGSPAHFVETVFRRNVSNPPNPSATSRAAVAHLERAPRRSTPRHRHPPAPRNLAIHGSTRDAGMHAAPPPAPAQIIEAWPAPCSVRAHRRWNARERNSDRNEATTCRTALRRRLRHRADRCVRDVHADGWTFCVVVGQREWIGIRRIRRGGGSRLPARIKLVLRRRSVVEWLGIGRKLARRQRLFDGNPGGRLLRERRRRWTGRYDQRARNDHGLSGDPAAPGSHRELHRGKQDRERPRRLRPRQRDRGSCLQFAGRTW